MSVLISHNYINTNFQVRPGATPSLPTSNGLIANVDWIVTNYYAYVTGNQTSNRCPGDDQIFAIPNITTSSPTIVNQTTVNDGGSVSNNVGIVSQVGMCLSTTSTTPGQYDTVILQYSSVNVTAGYSWASNLSYTFTPGTLYYLRAYILYNSVYYYGNSVVTVNTQLPAVTIYNAVIDVPIFNALYFTCQAWLDSSGGTPVTQRGFVYSTTNPTPTLSDTVLTIAGTSLGLMEGDGMANPSSTYHFRAYAINGAGVAYSQYSAGFVSGPFYTNWAVSVLVNCTTGTTSVNETRTLSIGSGAFSFGNDWAGSAWKTLQIYSFYSDYDGDGNALFTLKQGGVPISSYPVYINVNGVPNGGNIGLTITYNDPTAICCTRTASNPESSMIFARISDQADTYGAYKENYLQYYANPGSGEGYYDCGYGCQYYSYNPGCSTCTPTTTTTTTAPSITGYRVNVYNCITCVLIDSNVLVQDSNPDLLINRYYADVISESVYRVIDTNVELGGLSSNMVGSPETSCALVNCV